eukprot:g9427.t1
MAVAGFQPQSVNEVMTGIRAHSHAALDPRTGELKFANGYLDTERGKLICQLLYSMNSRSRHLFKGRSDGVAFSCATRKYEYKFESVWTKDTLLIYLRDRV